MAGVPGFRPGPPGSKPGILTVGPHPIELVEAPCSSPLELEPVDLVAPEGFGPSTPAFVARCSSPLSYGASCSFDPRRVHRGPPSHRDGPQAGTGRSWLSRGDSNARPPPSEGGALFHLSYGTLVAPLRIEL